MTDAAEFRKAALDLALTTGWSFEDAMRAVMASVQLNPKTCPRCGLNLEIHDRTLAGQGCNWNAAWSGLWAGIGDALHLQAAVDWLGRAQRALAEEYQDWRARWGNKNR